MSKGSIDKCIEITLIGPGAYLVVDKRQDPHKVLGVFDAAGAERVAKLNLSGGFGVDTVKFIQ